jgi:hypothetical protein
MTSPPGCVHARTRVIAEDEFAKYLECLDCGLLFETGELITKEEKPSSFKETLSDA